MMLLLSYYCHYVIDFYFDGRYAPMRLLRRVTVRAAVIIAATYSDSRYHYWWHYAGASARLLSSPPLRDECYIRPGGVTLRASLAILFTRGKDAPLAERYAEIIITERRYIDYYDIAYAAVTRAMLIFSKMIIGTPYYFRRLRGEQPPLRLYADDDVTSLRWYADDADISPRHYYDIARRCAAAARCQRRQLMPIIYGIYAGALRAALTYARWYIDADEARAIRVSAIIDDMLRWCWCRASAHADYALRYDAMKERHWYDEMIRFERAMRALRLRAILLLRLIQLRRAVASIDEAALRVIIMERRIRWWLMIRARRVTPRGRLLLQKAIDEALRRRCVASYASDYVSCYAIGSDAATSVTLLVAEKRQVERDAAVKMLSGAHRCVVVAVDDMPRWATYAMI